MTVTGKSTVAGIIGWPVSHSLSPVMHNAAFAALGLDWVYVPFPVAPGRLAQAVAGLRALGVAGFSVTIPHKVAILPLLDQVDPEAQLIGAVNTVALREGRLLGFNTDGVGLVAALSAKLGFSAPGRQVLVLGAGGAARSAVVALARAGAARIDLANRSPERGEELVQSLAGRLPAELCARSLEGLADPGYLASFDLVVNTTSLGMQGEEVPGLELPALKPGCALYDMVYAPPVTPLLARARSLGLPCANGLGMLVAQGEEAFALWTGQRPPEGCLERALQGAGQPGN